MELGAVWCNLVPPCAFWRNLVEFGATWCSLVHCGETWCSFVELGAVCGTWFPLTSVDWGNGTSGEGFNRFSHALTMIYCVLIT